MAGFAVQWIGESILGFAKSPISAIMMAIIIGMIAANTVRLPDPITAGLRFCASAIRIEKMPAASREMRPNVSRAVVGHLTAPP